MLRNRGINSGEVAESDVVDYIYAHFIVKPLHLRKKSYYGPRTTLFNLSFCCCGNDISERSGPAKDLDKLRAGPFAFFESSVSE